MTPSTREGDVTLTQSGS